MTACAEATQFNNITPDMLTYNTHLKRLVLPEYGRNIQQMVDHCLTIEDREERTRCAHTIVKSMSILLPRIREQEGWQQKLWDHLAIMSDFRLDIDWPVEPVAEDERHTEPDKMAYPASDFPHRNYGKSIQRMISRAALMDAGEEKDALIMLVANQMKKIMLAVNKDYADDSRIFKDLEMMSHGQISLSPELHRLCDYKVLPAPSKKKKKK